jgi:succinate-acetate transporter protein
VLSVALIALYLGVAALGDNTFIAAILLILSFTYLCDGIGVMIGGHNFLLAIGGYAGMLTSLIAFYVSGAIVIDSVMKREVLPIGKAGMRLAR